MPVYQIPNNNIGITKTFAGTIKDSGNNPIEGAVVALRRKGGSDYVAYTETDASGDYSFTVDADGDFVVGYKLSHDPNAAITDTDELGPATPYSSYTGQNCIRLSADSLYYPSPDSLTAWKSMPSATVVDSLGYQTGVFGNIAHTIVFGGSGSGASATLGAAVAGDYRARNSAPYYFVWTSDELNFGTYINKVTWTSFGNSYTAPLLKVSGTRVVYRINNGYISEGEYEINVNGQEYYARDEASTYYYGIQGISISGQYAYFQTYFPNEANSKTKEWIEEQFNGSSYNLGEWTSLSPPQGQRLTATLPGEQDRDDFDTTDYDETAFVEAFTDPNEVTKHGKQLYYSLIYGPGGIPGTPTGNSSTSAIKAQQAKIISQEELDILKGYFGKIGIVAELTSATGLSATTIANTLNFGYQMTQAITTYLNDVRSNGTDAWDLTTGYAGAYSGTNASVFSSIYREWQSFQRQKKGTDIAEADFGTKVYPILQKMGLSTLQTYNGTGWRTWSFGSGGVTSREGS